MSRHGTLIAASVIVTSLLLAIIVILRSFVFEFLIITGNSMSPAVENGDRILVNRLAYRSQEPSNGDIIAFKIDLKRMVKRVAGVPGNVVEVRNGVFYRDDEAIMKVPYITLNSRSVKRRSYGPVIMRDDHVFVMGDNKALSMDSRDFGTIPYQDIIGKVCFIYLPPGRMGKL